MVMDKHRRRIVLAAGGAAAGAGAGLWPAMARAEHGGPHPTPPPPPPSAGQRRVSVAALPANHALLESYRRAITAMKRLPQTDPRSWTAMARVHNRFCSHSNWYILPWHRAYLTSFERVCRQLSGDNNFRVPYWDWTVSRQIPPVFSEQMHGGQPNALFLPTRTSPPFPDPQDPANPYRTRSPNDSIPDFAVGPTVIESALREPNFERFGGSRPRQGATLQNTLDPAWQRRFGIAGPLESNPHNFVHGFVGGTMGSYLSPLDPLFWCHHANLDRLWWRWVRPGFANPTNVLWLNFQFTGQFVNGNGTAWNPRVRDLLNVNALGYTYQAIPPFSFPVPVQDVRMLRPLPSVTPSLAFRAADVPADTVISLNQVMTVALPTAQSAREITTRVLRNGARGGESPAAAGDPVATGRVLANVEAEIGPGPTPHVRVFLSCPYLSPDTPASDPHFVNSFAFFATEHGEGADHNAAHSQSTGARKTSMSLDLTRTLATLRETGRMPERLELQLLPVPLQAGADAPAVRLLKVEFAIS